MDVAEHIFARIEQQDYGADDGVMQTGPRLFLMWFGSTGNSPALSWVNLAAP